MLSALRRLGIRDSFRAVREIVRGGGPVAVRLVSVGRPEGLLVPTTKFVLEVERRDGGTTELHPSLPVPPPYAWAYRVARVLRVPVVSRVEPTDLAFSVRVPRGRSPGG